MHPGCFQTVFLLEDGVCDDELLLCAELQQQVPIVIAVSNPMAAEYPFPGVCIFAHSGTEIAKYYDLVICRDALEKAAEFRVKLILLCRLSLESRRIHTEECGILLMLITQREAHGDNVVTVTCWQGF